MGSFTTSFWTGLVVQPSEGERRGICGSGALGPSHYETIRDNTLFGSGFDEVRYRKVIHQCGLSQALALFEVGEGNDPQRRSESEDHACQGSLFSCWGFYPGRYLGCFGYGEVFAGLPRPWTDRTTCGKCLGTGQTHLNED